MNRLSLYFRIQDSFQDTQSIFQDSDGLIIATIASDRKTFSRSDSPLEVAVFFNHASTQTLKISVSQLLISAAFIEMHTNINSPSLPSSS